MTWQERVKAVAGHGFTERQAGFLVTVMLHAGVCLGRHYCAYARIAYGQKVHDLFRILVARGYVTVRRCGHNTARLYHLHHKPLYEAIGDTNNRHRKPMTLPRAVERLMVLDAVLGARELDWLATEREKVAYFTVTRRIPQSVLPALTFRSPTSQTVRYFVDKFPIGLTADGRRHVFLYLATRPMPMDFRLFLERHAELLRAIPEWTVKVLVPRHLADALTRYEQAALEQMGAPLRPTIRDELRWYFHARRNPSQQERGRYERAIRAFGAPRFQAVYRAWVERGDAVLDATMSPVLSEALARRTGTVEGHVLPHGYLHLSSLVGTA